MIVQNTSSSISKGIKTEFNDRESQQRQPQLSDQTNPMTQNQYINPQPIQRNGKDYFGIPSRITTSPYLGIPLNMNHPDPQNPLLPLPPDGFARQLTDLGKLYMDKDCKFGGELYDILSTKLLIFYDFCGKVGLKEEQYHNTLSSMLKDRANQFYYDQIANKGYNFNTMVDLTRSHFETEANKQEYLTLWRTTTLQKIKSENPEKKTSECFQTMIDILQKIQR
ncbi:integrase and RNaseH domain-containing protein, partial [Golovinomyces cichoracearum]